MPKRPLRFNIDNNQFIEGLQSLYKVTDKSWEDTDIGITHSQWKDGLALIGFEADPTTATDFCYLGIQKLGHTCINLKLKTATCRPIAVINYAAFPGRVEIDEQCNISGKGPKELLLELLNKTHSPPAG